VSVRPAAIGDAEAIAAIHVRSWQVGYRGVVAESVLAALSVEYGGVVQSCDTDFSRFAGVRWVNPLGS